jgi:hypothetical protein
MVTGPESENKMDAPPVAVSRVGRDADGDQEILRMRSSAFRVSLTITGPRSP